jgi:type IV pilus biogenesis protein CpaD/CtpE
MKLKMAGLAILMMALFGCASMDQSNVNDIDSTKVNQIVKGQTTTHELMVLFGEPDSKLIIAENNEQWIYKGRFKELDVILINGVVQNYIYKEGF